MATMYKLHSGVRNLGNRAARRKSVMGVRARFVQRIGGGDIIVRRNRPALLTEGMLNKHLKAIKAKIADNMLFLRTVTGEEVDINTMKAAAPAPAKPQPKPVLDTAANDRASVPEVRGADEPLLITEEVKVPEAIAPPVPEGKEAPPSVPPPAEEPKSEASGKKKEEEGEQEVKVYNITNIETQRFVQVG